MKRKELINKLKEFTEGSSRLPWAKLCALTDFDSFSTAFAFGYGWQNDDMWGMPIANLRMALFNIHNHPKDKQPTKDERLF